MCPIFEHWEGKSEVSRKFQSKKPDLVALLVSTTTPGRESSTTTASTLGSWVGAITRDVTGLAALVASLVLGTLGAFTA